MSLYNPPRTYTIKKVQEMTDNYDAQERTKAKPHKNRGKVAGYHVYLPRQVIIAALGREPTAGEELFAARIVLDKGTRQILIRLYQER